jgi:cyclophilin family peptidyl-prolyl cis-trans isomerase
VILTNLVLVLAPLAAQEAKPPEAKPADAKPAAEAKAKVDWDAPSSCIAGEDYVVKISVTVPKGAPEVPMWVTSPAAITVNGQPLAKERPTGLTLTPGSTSTVSLNLSAVPGFVEAVGGKEFKIGFAKEYLDSGEKDVHVMQAAEKGLDFMKIPVEELSKYHVYMQTNRGDMEIEFWPDVAPNHVRNFLDLAYTGFYDGKTFHRVKPGFMIQGGDPKGDGTGNGPRMVKAEFSQKKHERGVLSMARSASPDSASCQFFVMHGAAPFLDGQYSAFGKLVSGDAALDAIANAKGFAGGDGTVRPSEPQKIVKCTVVRAAGK